MPAQELVECFYQQPDRTLLSTLVIGRIREDEPVMCAAALVESIGDDAEVSDVLCDHRTPVALSCVEEIQVRECAELWSVGDSLHIV